MKEVFKDLFEDGTDFFTALQNVANLHDSTFRITIRPDEIIFTESLEGENRTMMKDSEMVRYTEVHDL